MCATQAPYAPRISFPFRTQHVPRSNHPSSSPSFIPLKLPRYRDALPNRIGRQMTHRHHAIRASAYSRGGRAHLISIGPPRPRVLIVFSHVKFQIISLLRQKFSVDAFPLY